MGIKHSATKSSGESGYAIEWNDEHKIDSDINFAGHSGINLGEPIFPSDIATKNYVDGMAGVSGMKIQHGLTELPPNTSSTSITVTFPEPFTTIPTVVANLKDLSVGCGILDLTTTGFRSAQSRSAKGIYWIAIGT